MKQIVQNLKTGETIIEDVPVPIPSGGRLLINTSRSLVSLGTERMLIEFGRANFIQKAWKQPEKVRKVFEKIRSDGLIPTIESVQNRLDEPLPLGYCNVGRVLEIPDLSDGNTSCFKVGDRVASNGHHAEYVCIPENLCAKIPDTVSDEEAAFTVVGSIALQGMRLCNPTFGETIAVVGLGLIGLLTTQFLVSNGCRVVGIDISSDKLELANQWGVHPVNAHDCDQVAAVMQQTEGVGADGVIVTAAAKGNGIISKAARMSRKRGRIILVGVVGLNLNRADFYEKELTFQVSCSYGPGRYDENYEEKNMDYPISYVRWTEKRNFEAVLSAIETGRLNVKSLITDRVLLNDYQKIYGYMNKTGSIATILVYPEKENAYRRNSFGRTVKLSKIKFQQENKEIGIIGSGNFTKMTVLPILKKNNAPVRSISSANGLSGTHLAKQYGIPISTTDYREILSDPLVGMVMITTRHNLHAKLILEALQAGKDVFVEKPLCLNNQELDDIQKMATASERSITVGFNRRFSPHVQAIKKAMGTLPGPINLSATMNAGALSANAWVHDISVGGGRIIGEACHFIDLLLYLVESPIEAVCMNALGPKPEINTDNASILLRFKNGSNGVVNYFSNGHKGYSKERVEVYSHGRVAIVDNFRKTETFGFKGFKRLKTRIDKGHAKQFALLIDRVCNGGPPLIPLIEIENVTLASFACLESLKRNAWVRL